MALPSFIEPMLLLPSKVVPRGEQWLYELKFDGYRGIAMKNGATVRLVSRNNVDLSHRFPHLVAAVSALPCRTAILDGEITCLDRDGRPCFEDLQSFAPERQQFQFFYGFDLLHLNGRDLRAQPLTERKRRLQEVLTSPEPACGSLTRWRRILTIW